jgi:hypothetical protein
MRRDLDEAVQVIGKQAVVHRIVSRDYRYLRLYERWNSLRGL